MILFVFSFVVLCAHTCFNHHRVSPRAGCRHGLVFATFPRGVTKLPACSTDVTTCTGSCLALGMPQNACLAVPVDCGGMAFRKRLVFHATMH
jgi:hypothetical protein